MALATLTNTMGIRDYGRVKKPDQPGYADMNGVGVIDVQPICPTGFEDARFYFREILKKANHDFGLKAPNWRIFKKKLNEDLNLFVPVHSSLYPQMTELELKLRACGQAGMEFSEMHGGLKIEVPSGTVFSINHPMPRDTDWYSDPEPLLLASFSLKKGILNIMSNGRVRFRRF